MVGDHCRTPREAVGNSVLWHEGCSFGLTARRKIAEAVVVDMTAEVAADTD